MQDLLKPELMGGTATEGLFWLVKVQVPVDEAPGQFVEETYVLHNNWFTGVELGNHEKGHDPQWIAHPNAPLKPGDELEFDVVSPTYSNSPYSGMAHTRRIVDVLPEVTASVGEAA